MRKYLNVEKYAAQEGALYVDEDGNAIFRAPPGLSGLPRDQEEYRAGLLMTPEGELRMGVINLACNNWEETECNFTMKEAEWASLKMLRLVKSFKGE